MNIILDNSFTKSFKKIDKQYHSKIDSFIENWKNKTIKELLDNSEFVQSYEPIRKIALHGGNIKFVLFFVIDDSNDDVTFYKIIPRENAYSKLNMASLNK